MTFETQHVKELKNIKLADVRSVISKQHYKRSIKKAMLVFLFDLVIFLCGLSLVVFFHFFLIQLLGGLIMGLASAMMFIWAHDAAHGTLFKNNRIAEFLGTVFMFPALNVYRLWVYGHNKVHHGFTSLSSIDWIWRPLTPEEYYSLGKFQQFLYRVERQFWTCGFHYIRKVWWSAMWCFTSKNNPKDRRKFLVGKIYVVLYVIAMSLFLYYFAGGFLGIVFGLILPFIIFNYCIALIVYLHHTHPEIPFFWEKKEWSHVMGLMYCATVIHCPKWAEFLTHNIMIHVPHHVEIAGLCLTRESKNARVLSIHISWIIIRVLYRH